MPELKIISDNGSSFVVGGYGVHFGDADLAGDRFTKATDFWFDRITQNPPVLYQHGQDAMLKRTAVGRVTSTHVDDIGVWVEAQITAAKQYADVIRQLVAKGVLGWSSGSVPHLVQRVKSDTPGVTEITSWPIVEFSLTPTPAEPRTVGIKELKMLAAADPVLQPIVREAERVATKEAAKAVTDLPDSAFAFIAAGGVLDDEKKTSPRSARLYPHHDESGDVDPDALAASIVEARKSADSSGLAHLMRHDHAHASGEHDDAHTKAWSHGAAPTLLIIADKLSSLAAKVASEQTNMLHLDMDIKDGQRIRPELALLITELETGIHDVVKWAQTVDRGEDGRARVDLLRQKLALMELEV